MTRQEDVDEVLRMRPQERFPLGEKLREKESRTNHNNKYKADHRNILMLRLGYEVAT